MEELPIKLKMSELNELLKAHDFLIKHYDVLSDHELLLLHHAIKFRDSYQTALVRKKASYTIKFDAVTALAFAQLWHTDYKILKELPRKIILDINAKIDKHRKKISTIYYETPE